MTASFDLSTTMQEVVTPRLQVDLA